MAIYEVLITFCKIAQAKSGWMVKICENPFFIIAI